MLCCGSTTPQDYPEWSGFVVEREREWGHRRQRAAGIYHGTPLMRIYIIGNDGITLCREAPATRTEGEVAVASKEELHAAPLSGKRVLALWNALPGVEKRRRIGDRAAMIDQLWTAIEALPEPEPQSDTKRPSKQGEVIAMLQRPEGATVDELASAMGWQRHKAAVYAGVAADRRELGSRRYGTGVQPRRRNRRLDRRHLGAGSADPRLSAAGTQFRQAPRSGHRRAG